MSAMPIYRSAYNTVIDIIDVFLFKFTKGTVPITNRIIPGMANFFTPCLSNRRPDISIITAIINAPGKSTKPLVKADFPRID